MTDKIPTVDFGAPDTHGAHVFRVQIPASRAASVVIVEDYGYRGLEGGIPRDEERAILKRPVWSAIADIARREFNDRLKAAKVHTGRWHTGTNLVDRLFRGGVVTDFVDLRWWPVFNVADSCVVVGSILLGVYTLFFEGRREAKVPPGDVGDAA